MAETTSPLLYEDDFRIEKRTDGTEDFHCTISSCAGVFSYRTLRALNNHRASSHSLPDIPKRKRGPKKSESSRARCRSADGIKRQVMKRAMDISKREQGCRSMARLRAARLAMAQAGEKVDGEHTRVTEEVGKSLENWEGAALTRRSLLERRIRMARMEWAMKGEAVPLLTTEADSVKVRVKDDKFCFYVHGSEGVETVGGCHPAIVIQDAIGEDKESDFNNKFETGYSQADPNTDDFAEAFVVHSGDIVDMDGSFCKNEVNINGEKGCAKNVISYDNFEAFQVWRNHSVRKFVSVNQHELKSVDERFLAPQADEFLPCFGRNRGFLECCDMRQF